MIFSDWLIPRGGSVLRDERPGPLAVRWWVLLLVPELWVAAAIALVFFLLAFLSPA